MPVSATSPLDEQPVLASPHRMAVALRSDEYAVAMPPGQHRGHSENPDPIRMAQGLGEGLVGRALAGIGLLRATAGFGFRLVGLGRLPLALAAGPLGRTRVLDRGGLARPPVAVRFLDEDLEIETDELAVAYGAEVDPIEAGDHLVVFVPAPGDDERSWRKAAEELGGTYASRLSGLLGWTPVQLRVDDTVGLGNASVELSGVLQELVEAWPTAVRRIALIAHGSGGLVARGALGVVAPGERPWADLVTELIAIGTPHLQASPQKFTRDVGRKLEERLAGILAADEEIADVPPRQGVRYLLVTDRAIGMLNPAGQVLGGVIWWRQRALRQVRRARDLFPTAERHEVAVGAQPLANHPEIHRALMDWLR
jgi:hypothetical protein